MVYFESKKRGGPARIGVLETGKKEIETPCIIDEAVEINDKESLWFSSKSPKKEINILPSKTSPNYVPEDVAEYFGKQNIKIESNLDEKRIISPVIGGGNWPDLRKKLADNAPKSEIITIESLKKLRVQDEFIKIISKIRETVNENTAIFAPGIATPQNLSFFVYLGIDLFDSTLASLEASRDIYLTKNGSEPLNYLKELTCCCPICSNLDIEQIRAKEKQKRTKLLEKHNKNILNQEIKTIRNYIKKEEFREYVEKNVRSTPYLTAGLRNLDKIHYDYLEKRTPTFEQTRVLANTVDSLNRPQIKRFRERVLERYSPPTSDIAVLLPCSAKKPYSRSKTHRIISSALRDIGNQMIVTSPLGLVPRELEITYPAQHYDIPVIGEWFDDEKKMIKNLIKNYFSKNRFEKIIVHLDGELLGPIKKIFNQLGMEPKFTSKNRDPRSRKSLKQLKKEINGFNGINSERETIRSLCNYQFGDQEGESFIKDTQIRGRYPKLILHANNKQLAAISPQYGALSLTIRGAEKINTSNYEVKIGSFYPEGSVLAPGVIQASEKIRPNDEVIFYGEKAFGVGRAKMSGFEMEESDRGIAIKTRHVKEIQT
ncbi:hypothetical protein C9439_06050 [archaeon SCG-AAA382B04]|nr:hypothetical protein C9439_06050 [archaeon SCG-AAA382B04]